MIKDRLFSAFPLFRFSAFPLFRFSAFPLFRFSAFPLYAGEEQVIVLLR